MELVALKVLKSGLHRIDKYCRVLIVSLYDKRFSIFVATFYFSSTIYSGEEGGSVDVVIQRSGYSGRSTDTVGKKSC